MDVFRDGYRRGLAFSWALARDCLFSYYLFHALLSIGVRVTYARPVALIVAAADFCVRARRNPANILLLIYVGVAFSQRPMRVWQMPGYLQALYALWLSFMSALVYTIVRSHIGEVLSALQELAGLVRRWWRPAVPGDRDNYTYGSAQRYPDTDSAGSSADSDASSF